MTWLGERVDEGCDLFQCRGVTLEVGDVRDAVEPAQSSTRDQSSCLLVNRLYLVASTSGDPKVATKLRLGL